MLLNSTNLKWKNRVVFSNVKSSFIQDLMPRWTSFCLVWSLSRDWLNDFVFLSNLMELTSENVMENSFVLFYVSKEFPWGTYDNFIGKIYHKQRVHSPWVYKILLHRGKLEVVKEGSRSQFTKTIDIMRIQFPKN